MKTYTNFPPKVFIILLGTVMLLSSSLPIVSQNGKSTLPDQTILEITGTEMGIGACGMELYGRLYQDGRFEYETLKEPNPKTANDYCRRVKKEIHLDAHDVDSIVRLLGQADLLNAKDYYPGKSLIDYVHLLTIVYLHQGRDKKIKLVNYGYTLEQWKGVYPSSLNELLNKVIKLQK